MSTITLPNIRVGSDLQVRVRLKDGGVAIDWSTLQNIKACIYSDAQRALAGRCAFSIDEEDNTLLVCSYAANKPQYLGVNRIVISAKYMGETKTFDKPAFTFVRWTADQEGEEITIDDPDVDVEIAVEDISSSILQEAVDAAFTAADRANEAAAAAEHMVDIHTGPQGEKGDTGETPDISIGTVTTVAPGTPASASMTGTPEEPVLNLSIPQGVVGATPNFTVGTVTTGEPGSSVIVTITGTPEAPVLNVTIPQGMQGNTGSSVDYPYELVNNLTTNDATKGLSAAQGYVLDGKVSQLEAKVDDLEDQVPPLFDHLVGKTTEQTTFKTGVAGNIKLNGTGYYGGKNLLEYSDVAEGTTNGITWSVSGGEIHLNGTATANTYISFPITELQLAGGVKMDVRTVISGSFDKQINILLCRSSTSYTSATFPTYAVQDGGVNDTDATISSTYNKPNKLYLYIPNGTVCTSVVFKPMLTYSARWGAGDYEIGGAAVYFDGEVKLPNAQNVCVQGSPAITITTYDYSLLEELPSVPADVSALLGEHKLVPFSGNNVCAIRDGLVGSNMASCLLNNLQSGTVKVIGKNLLDIEGLQTTGGNVVFTPIALLPFTTYTYSDDYGQWYGKNARISIYSGNSDSDRAEKYVIVDSAKPNRSSFTFTTDAGPLFWLRYYPNNIVNIKAQTTNCMLAEGDKVSEFEHYEDSETQLSENLPSVIDNPCYLFSSGNAISGTFYLQLMGEEGVLPSYWETYMAGKIIELKALMASTSMHSLIFQFFTDVHLPSNAGYSPALMKEIKEKAGIGDIVFGGDILNYAWDDADLAKRIFYDFREKYLVGDGHTFCIRGNHDAYHNAGDSLFYNTLVRPLNDRFDTNGANSIHRVFYYIDDKSQKVRLINFDSGDWSDREFKSQFEWLVETLNTVPSGWGCILFTHIVVSGETPANDIRAIVKAFIERRTGTQTLYNGETVSFDFTSATGEMVCIIGGHNHKDWSDTAIGCPCIAVTCDAIGEKTNAGPSMTLGTSTEQAFDVFFIDLDAKTITAKRIGAGEDRSWTYGE